MNLEIEDRLVEQSVQAAIDREPDAHFHREREATYSIDGAEARDRAFSELHARWFRRLGLDLPIRQALAEQPQIAGLIERCRVSAVVRSSDEGSQLYVQRAENTEGKPLRQLVFRIRPAALVDAQEVLRLLRRELVYVADMLDPTFGYEPTLPRSLGGPLAQRLLVDRYGAAWAATVVGRLVRKGFLPGASRESALARFRAAFPALGDEAVAAFDRLFQSRPSHAELVRMTQEPQLLKRSAGASEGASICALCRMPAHRVDLVRDLRTQAAIAADFPEWKSSHRVCPRCAEVYREGAERGVEIELIAEIGS